MVFKFSLQYILFLLLILILPFTDAFSQYTAFFSYFDELYLLLILLFIILRFKNNKIKILKLEKHILILFTIMVIIGFLSSVIFQIQSLKVAFVELMMFSKFILGYFLSRIIFLNFNLNRYKCNIIRMINLLTFIMFSLFIFDIIFNYFETIGYRFGIKASNLVFSHPTYLAGFSMIMLSLYTFFGEYKIKGRNLYIIMNLLLMLSTLRNKALIFVCVYLFIKPIYQYSKSSEVKFYLILLSGSSVLLLFQNAIVERLLDSNTVRNMFYNISFELAINYFPFGAGLGTFASYISGKYYSSLYFQYGLNNVYGMTPMDYSYVADTFWPMVISQFGIIGLILFIIIILNLGRIILKINNHYNKLSCILIMIYILVSSTSEAIFNTYIGVALFMILGIFINSDQNKKDISLDFEN